MRIEDFFRSNEYISILALSGLTTEEIVAKQGLFLEACMDYVKVNGSIKGEQFNCDGLEEYLKCLCKKVKEIGEDNSNKTSNEAIIVKSLKDVLEGNGISDEILGRVDYNKVITEIFARNDFMYHATSSANLDSIKQNGLNPDVIAEQSMEIAEINEIYKSHNNNSVFLCKFSKNGNEVFFSKTLLFAFNYAQAPEWFRNFVDFKNFNDKDFNAARNHVEKVMNDYNFSEDEKARVFVFFEKYWKKFTKDTYPSVVVVPPKKENLDDIRRNIEFYNEYFPDRSPIENAIEDASYYYNSSSTEKIETDKAVYLKMFSVKELVQEIESYRERLTSKDQSSALNENSFDESTLKSKIAELARLTDEMKNKVRLATASKNNKQTLNNNNKIKCNEEVPLKREVYNNKIKCNEEVSLKREVYNNKIKCNEEVSLKREVYNNKIKCNEEVPLEREVYNNKIKCNEEVSLEREVYNNKIKCNEEVPLKREVYNNKIKCNEEIPLEREI